MKRNRLENCAVRAPCSVKLSLNRGDSCRWTVIRKVEEVGEEINATIVQDDGQS